MARIRRLVVDESHLVNLWGLTIGKALAFRQAGDESATGEFSFLPVLRVSPSPLRLH